MRTVADPAARLRLVFGGSRAEGDHSPRFLLVSEHFPPRVSAGSLRWERFAEHFHRRGWSLDVVMTAGAAEGAMDPGRVPDTTRIFACDVSPGFFDRTVSRLSDLRAGKRIPTPADGEGKGGEAPAPRPAVRSSIAPDQLRWLPRSLADVHRAAEVVQWALRERSMASQVADAIRRALADREYRAVLTSGPYHWTHLCGLEVSRTLERPLVLDFRDPWSLRRRLNANVATPLFFVLARLQERRAVRGADVVVTNTSEVREAMERVHGGSGARFVTVFNGFDEEPLPAPGPRSTFVASYGGSIYLDREPVTLFRAIRAVVDRLALSPSEFRLELIGDVMDYDGVPTEVLARDAGVSEYVSLFGKVPRDELRERQAAASLLVSLPQDSPWAVPSKIFEYMQFPAWVLAFADPESPSARVLAGTGADVVPIGDVEAAADCLERRICQHRRGERPEVATVRDERFSRENQARELIGVIEDVLSSGRR